METVRIRDPGWKKVGSGIRDKHPGSATLLFLFLWVIFALLEPDSGSGSTDPIESGSGYGSGRTTMRVPTVCCAGDGRRQAGDHANLGHSRPGALPVPRSCFLQVEIV
jgi:hypothetical protein